MACPRSLHKLLLLLLMVPSGSRTRQTRSANKLFSVHIPLTHRHRAQRPRQHGVPLQVQVLRRQEAHCVFMVCTGEEREDCRRDRPRRSCRGVRHTQHAARARSRSGRRSGCGSKRQQSTHPFPEALCSASARRDRVHAPRRTTRALALVLTLTVHRRPRTRKPGRARKVRPNLQRCFRSRRSGHARADTRRKHTPTSTPPLQRPKLTRLLLLCETQHRHRARRPWKRHRKRWEW